MWRNIGLGAAFLVVIAAPEALHAVAASPEPQPSRQLSPIPAGKAFAPTCNAAEVADTRPDPAWLGKSFSHDNCAAPATPAPVDGFTARQDKIVAGMTAVKSFIVRSDAYQKCIQDFVAARKAKAATAKLAIDVPLITIENHRLLVSEDNKKKVANRMTVAINAFNAYGSECPD